MNYGYQGPPVKNNFGRPSAPTSFGYPSDPNDPSYPPNNPPCPPSNSPYPPNNSPYPPSNQSYPPSNPSYPPSNSPYPPSNQSYPPSNQSYPPSNSPYPSSQGACYPPGNPSYPPSQNIRCSQNLTSSGMPAPTPYPTQPGFPNPTEQPSYPPQQASYPPQQTSYPPQRSSYPPQQSPYPPQQSPYSPQQSPYPPQQSPYPPQQSPYPPQQTPYPRQQVLPPPQQTAHPPQQTPYPSRQLPIAPNLGGNSSGGPWSKAGSTTSAASSVKHSPTVLPYAPFDPRKDAEALRKAMKGFGTDEKALIEVLTRRVNSQRQEIALQFKTLYGRDLIKDLKSETSGNFENLLVAMVTPLPQYYASELKNAMAGVGTKENVLFEILCTVSNHEMRTINEAYQAMYYKRLEDDLRSDTSSHLKRLLVGLSCGNRDESSHVDQAAAREDAKKLLQAGELRAGTDESAFHQIFVINNVHQLQQIFNEYQNITGHTIEKAIDKEFSGDLKDAFLAIAKSVQNRTGFFAEQLYKSMKGLGTDDNSLIRLIVTRCETDLGEIKNQFQRLYSSTLQDNVASECSGDYKKCLLSLIG